MSVTGGLLAGRLALVTGGASGIGRAVCCALARDGAKVAVVDVNKDGAVETQSMLSNASEHFSTVTDVSSSASVGEMFSQVQGKFSTTPSIVINAAGIIRDKSMLKMTEGDFDKVISVNLKGTYLVMQAALRAMKEAKMQDGSIVNISSIVGKVGNLGQTNYSASKAGVIGMTKTVAKEMGRHNIRINAVLPGMIETQMTAGIPDHVSQMVKMMIPLARFGQPEEVAELCAFLASSRASYITGQAIEVTGGLNF